MYEVIVVWRNSQMMEWFRQASAAYDLALSEALTGLSEEWRTADFRDGPLTWTLFSCKHRQTPHQGWKIHISSSIRESPALFERVVPLLIAKESSFKLPASLEHISTINSGRAGNALVGKIVTVYPTEDCDLHNIITSLDRLWRSDRAPQILTDLQVRTGASIYIRFGSFRSEVVVQDAFGRWHPGVRRPDGALIPDERRLDGIQPQWVTSPIPDAVPVLPQAQQELTICGRRYFLLETIRSAPKGMTFLAADEDLQTYVVKVARRGVGEDATGQDSCERLKREAWLLTFVTGKGLRSPRVFAIADHTIVLEDIDGTPLNELPGDKVGEAFQSLVSAVASLHRLGVVHRDLKLSNAILKGADVYLIDFELASFVGATDAPSGGTRGYISPERVEAPVATASDIFSLGASLAHAALGADLATLVPSTGRLLGLLICSGQRPTAKVVAAAMNADPSKRPSAWELQERLAELSIGLPIELKAVVEPPPHNARKLRNRRMRKIIETAIHCGMLANIIPSTSHVSTITHAAGPPKDTISSGLAGIIMGLAIIDSVTNRSNFEEAIVAGAERLALTDKNSPALGLFTGQAGIAFVLALVGNRFSRNDLSAEAQRRFIWAADHIVELDLFSGAAGVIWGACILGSILKAEWPLRSAEQAARTLRESVQEHDRLLVWGSSEIAVENAYLGAAHGSAGIAMSLGIWGRETGCARSVELSRETFLCLYEHGRTSDQVQLRHRLNSETGTSAGIWCHGSAGYLWSILQAFGDHRPLRSPIDWALQALMNIPLVDNASYCHGMAGQLDLWSMLARYERFSKIAPHRAALSARLMEQIGFRIKNSWGWPLDESGQIEPDLWTGMLGPACALALFQGGYPGTFFCANTLARVFASK